VQCLGDMPWVSRATAFKPDALLDGASPCESQGGGPVAVVVKPLKKKP